MYSALLSWLRQCGSCCTSLRIVCAMLKWLHCLQARCVTPASGPTTISPAS